MDDLLEQPNAIPQTTQLSQNQDDRDNSEENDAVEDVAEGGLDWAKVLPLAASRPVIPKRGEKEFEPRAQDSLNGDEGHPAHPTSGTALQQHVLNRAREAMFEALKATRTVSSKNISYGIWYPDLSRTHVTVARGVHFSSIGHSAPRHTEEEDYNEPATSKSKIQKRLELLPEEAIYLVERGSMFCWKNAPTISNARKIDSTVFDCPITGPPMSVQHVYTEMIGRECLTLEKYQVYAYLKRLGYAVMRAEPPDLYYPIPAPFLQTPSQTSPSISQRVISLFSRFASGFIWLLTRSNSFDRWHPVRFSKWFSRDKSYQSLFNSLRFMSSGHNAPLHESQAMKNRRLDTPYKIFYNVYKPSTPLKKSAPPKPDFQVVVVNARTTPMPTLYELTSLFDQVPEVLLPLSRRNSAQKNANTAPTLVTNTTPSVMSRILSLGDWLLCYFLRWVSHPFPLLSQAGKVSVKVPPKPNPFASLKMGKKVIVIAAVDSGNISFFRFGQGVFEKWPMV